MDLEETPWADSAEPTSQSSDLPTTQDSASTAKTKPPSLTPASSGSTRASRTTPRRVVAQPTRLEVVDDPLGPLGGGSGGSDTDNVLTPGISASSGRGALGEGVPPVPPQKEHQPLAMRTTMQQQSQQGPLSGGGPGGARSGGPRDPHRIDDDDDGDDDLLGRRSGGARAPPPVQAASPTVRSSNAPSVSVEQASKPSFQITVGDPHKVGDLTSSHIVYSVRTRVRCPSFSLFIPFFFFFLASYLHFSDLIRCLSILGKTNC